MSSKLQVYNMALGLLQQTAIASDADTGPKGTALNTYYDNVFRKSLEMTDWDFASKFQSLSLISSAANDSPYVHLYALPHDHMKTQKVYDADQNSVGYLITNSGLYSDTKPVYMKYTFYNDNYGDFPESFIDVLVYGLAEAVAPIILGSTNTTDFLGAKFQEKSAIGASQRVGRSNMTYRLESNWENIRYT